MDPEMAQMMLQQAGGGIPRDSSTPDKFVVLRILLITLANYRCALVAK